MALNIKLDAFEGPFDLLFHLIEKNQIDINDIPISELTEQYLDYLKDIDKSQLDMASEFLVMAATLLSIKSKMLLPAPKDEEAGVETAATVDADPREELVAKLMEYKKYKEIADLLKNMEEEQAAVLERSPEDLTPLWPEDFSLSKEITLRELVMAFSDVIKRHRGEPKVHFVSRDPIPLALKIDEIYEMMKHRRTKVFFSRLFTVGSSEAELVVTFLAVLELIKMNKITAVQEELFGEIVMAYRRDKE
jgi:segregation and condensation protein A